ncbi:MAG: hypothetical protein AABM29_05570 [Actinomycetota bacterium]
MEGFWPIFFLLVVLKIPVVGALWLVWWASRAQPLADDAPDQDDGGFRRFRAERRQPRGPRRGGPHGAGAKPLPDCPPGGRSRVVRPPVPVRAGLGHARGAAEPAPEAPQRR